MPSPATTPLQPYAWLMAPGGLSTSTSVASQFHSTELAAVQPCPWSAVPRFVRRSALPRIITLS